MPAIQALYKSAANDFMAFSSVHDGRTHVTVTAETAANPDGLLIGRRLMAWPTINNGPVRPEQLSRYLSAWFGSIDTVELRFPYSGNTPSNGVSSYAGSVSRILGPDAIGYSKPHVWFSEQLRARLTGIPGSTVKDEATLDALTPALADAFGRTDLGVSRFRSGGGRCINHRRIEPFHVKARLAEGNGAAPPSLPASAAPGHSRIQTPDMAVQEQALYQRALGGADFASDVDEAVRTLRMLGYLG